MKKIVAPLAVLGAGVTLTLFGLASAQGADAECRVTDVSASQGCEVIMPPCESEDSTGPCFWDAQERGNGLGRSFVAIPDMGVIPIA